MTSIFKPKTPETKPVATMPDEGDPAVMAADAKRRSSMMARTGRKSTILSGSNESILSGAAPEYSKEKMG